MLGFLSGLFVVIGFLTSFGQRNKYSDNKTEAELFRIQSTGIDNS
jgi:hypothetical protein